MGQKPNSNSAAFAEFYNGQIVHYMGEKPTFYNIELGSLFRFKVQPDKCIIISLGVEEQKYSFILVTSHKMKTWYRATPKRNITSLFGQRALLAYMIGAQLHTLWQDCHLLGLKYPADF